MAEVTEDRIKEKTFTTGTGDIALAGNLVGFRPFSRVCSQGDTFYCTILAVDANEMPTGQWETGRYTFNSAVSISRSFPSRGSAGNNTLVNFSAGTKHIYIDTIADQVKRWAGLTVPSSTVNYIAHESIIANPSRGLMRQIMSAQVAGAVNSATVASLRTNSGISLFELVFDLSGFVNAPLDNTVITNIRNNLTNLRTGGGKCSARFSYETSGPGNDASVTRVLAHIDQLAPIFTDFDDVIFVVEAGFIGTLGLWMTSVSFGNDGVLSQQNIIDRRKVVDKLLAVLPIGRYITLPAIRFKKVLYGVADPISDTQAKNGTTLARIGFYNDGFLSSVTDFGFYNDIDRTEQPYLAQETKWLPMIGKSYSFTGPRTDCVFAEPELKQFHWSAINDQDLLSVLDIWRAQGCFSNIEKALGYRLSLLSSTIPKRAFIGSGFTVNIVLTNTGYAAPVNQRTAKIVLRNPTNGATFVFSLSSDPRDWQPGQITISQVIDLPSNIPAATYELFLHLPDLNAGLSTRPEYAIQFANTGLWDSTTGYNKLNQTIILS